jgi:hypothetical protein
VLLADVAPEERGGLADATAADALGWVVGDSTALHTGPGPGARTDSSLPVGAAGVAKQETPATGASALGAALSRLRGPRRATPASPSPA